MHDHDAEINSEKLELIIKDQRVRRELTRECHFWFFHVYFAHYIRYKSGRFHKELFELTEDTTQKAVVIEAFRGSGKTTLMGTSYAIWSILGVQQRKFVLLIAKTESQARQYLANIKMELESNKLLKSDLGPFEEPNDEWRATSIVLPNYGARITVASIDNSIRGIKHGAHRPDLIICDDLEDLDIVKTQESRDKMHKWLTGDVIPLGDIGTRLIVIGTKLHNDSIIGRLKKAIAEGTMDGISKRYPFLNEDGTAMWAEKFQTEADINTLRRSVPSLEAWEREYMLNIIASEDQVVRREWIQYYDSLPADNSYRYSATGVDPAIGEKQNNDCTAMVSGRIYGRRKSLKIYVLPNPVNERLDSLKALETIKAKSNALGNGIPTVVWVESVAYQKSIIQQLVSDRFPAKEYKSYGTDKRGRLSIISSYIQAGTVVFPKHGAETLIEQIVGFGTEKHDDLADALCILVSSVIDQESVVPKGYHELFTEKMLADAYHEHLEFKGERRLGVSLADRTRPNSAIVLRSENAAQVLYHGPITDTNELAKKAIELAIAHYVPLSEANIFLDKTDIGKELRDNIQKHAEGKFIRSQYETYQYYGLFMNDSPTHENDIFADNWMRGYSKLAGWLQKGGKLVDQHVFDDLLYIIYNENNNKRKLIDRYELFEDGIDTSIPDALALTITKDKRHIPIYDESELEEEEMMYPEIGI